MSAPDLKTIEEDFSLLDDWEDRYRYLIDLGRSLEPLPDEARTAANKVRGCASQVWVETRTDRSAPEPVLTFRGDSDAHIVRGLIALTFAFYSGRAATDILRRDAIELFQRLGLTAHLTPQRSNGVRAMIERVRADARAALEPASTV